MGKNKNGTVPAEVPEEVRGWISEEKDLEVKKMELEIQALEKKNKASQQPTYAQLEAMVAKLTKENSQLSNELRVARAGNAYAVALLDHYESMHASQNVVKHSDIYRETSKRNPGTE